MKATRCCWSLVSALCCLSFVSVQDPKPTVRRPSADALRRAHELAETAPEHEVFRRLAGKWSVSLRTTSSDGATHEDTGEVVGRAMLGGRYLALDYTLEVQGNAVDALQILGFDRLKGLYTASWRDTGATWAVDCQGQPGAEVGDITMFGTMVDAFTPDGRPFRLHLDARDRREIVVRYSEGAVGKEVLLQEQRWVR